MYKLTGYNSFKVCNNITVLIGTNYVGNPENALVCCLTLRSDTESLTSV